MSELVYAREQTARRIGRRRAESLKAASIALNAAVNNKSVLKCAVHGDDCDGVTVTNDHLTLATRKSRGFKEPYPVLVSEDRSMIDWYTLLQEERKDQT